MEKSNVNINIQISDELHKKLKLKAVMQEKTLKDLITQILEKKTKK